MFPSYPCHHDTRHHICYVGRLISGPHTLPGKYQTLHNNLYSSFNGRTHMNGNKEVLTVVAGCQVGWMPYTAGNVIPTHAVTGGFLASGTGSRLFVIRGQVGGYIPIGYYDPNMQKGYIDYCGAHVLTEMEMLVVVWLTYLCKLAPLQSCPPGFINELNTLLCYTITLVSWLNRSLSWDKHCSFLCQVAV